MVGDRRVLLQTGRVLPVDRFEGFEAAVQGCHVLPQVGHVLPVSGVHAL